MQINNPLRSTDLKLIILTLKNNKMKTNLFLAVLAIILISTNLIVRSEKVNSFLSLEQLCKNALADPPEWDGCWECITDGFVEGDCICDPEEAADESYYTYWFRQCWESAGGLYDEDLSACETTYHSCDGNSYNLPC